MRDKWAGAEKKCLLTLVVVVVVVKIPRDGLFIKDSARLSEEIIFKEKSHILETFRPN